MTALKITSCLLVAPLVLTCYWLTHHTNISSCRLFFFFLLQDELVSQFLSAPDPIDLINELFDRLCVLLEAQNNSCDDRHPLVASGEEARKNSKNALLLCIAVGSNLEAHHSLNVCGFTFFPSFYLHRNRN